MMDKIYVSKSCTQQKLIYFFCHSLHRMQRHGNEKKALAAKCNVSVLISSTSRSWVETRFGQIKDYEIGICCFSTKYTE